jgi:hypothetical protein
MRTAFFILASLLAATAAAQEIDVFDPTDFVDPRIRDAIFQEDGFGVRQKGMDFALVRISAGRVFDYQWRNASTKANPYFANLTSSFYRGDKQLNLKIAKFSADSETGIPTLRTTLQAGQYFLRGDIACRVLATWALERNPYDGSGATRRQSFNHEFGLQTDIQLRLPKPIKGLDHIDGSLIWMRRHINEDTYVDRISYLYRFRERQKSNGRLQLNASLGFGAEHANGWQCCLARGVFTATYMIPRVNIGVNAAFAPSFAPAGGGRRSHRELALYLDGTIIAWMSDLVR